VSKLTKYTEVVFFKPLLHLQHILVRLGHYQGVHRDKKWKL